MMESHSEIPCKAQRPLHLHEMTIGHVILSHIDEVQPTMSSNVWCWLKGSLSVSLLSWRPICDNVSKVLSLYDIKQSLHGSIIQSADQSSPLICCCFLPLRLAQRICLLRPSPAESSQIAPSLPLMRQGFRALPPFVVLCVCLRCLALIGAVAVFSANSLLQLLLCNGLSLAIPPHCWTLSWTLWKDEITYPNSCTGSFKRIYLKTFSFFIGFPHLWFSFFLRCILQDDLSCPGCHRGVGLLLDPPSPGGWLS